MVDIDAGEDFTSFSGMSVQDFNDLAYTYAMEGDYQGVDDAVLDLKGSAGDTIASVQVHQGGNVIDYHGSVSGIELKRGGVVVYSSAISFCDEDGICEPCSGIACPLSENALSCEDCSSGTADMACDAITDGICDPDCLFDETDPDCLSNCSQDCGIDLDTALTCADYKGIECETGDDCIGGYMVFAADWMYCCLGGTCGVEGEHIETSAEMMQHPLSTITPSGETAASVEAVGFDNYCSTRFKGQICAQEEYCDGSQVEFYYRTYCCTGSCRPVPVTVTPYEEFTFTDEQVEQFFNTSAAEEEFKADLAEGEEILSGDDEAVAARDNMVFEAEEEMLRELEEDERVGLRDVLEPVAEGVKDMDPIRIAMTVLAILVVIALLVGLFRRSSEKKIAETGPVQTVHKSPDLQQFIDYYISKGYDYPRIRQGLISKGHNPNRVDQEIQKNSAAQKTAQQRIR
ncbi:hypothetical protein ACFL3V_01435 [Nanoarchaeota archaeon]